MIDKQKTEQAIELLIEAIGEDCDREGLVETPKRLAKLYEEVLAGYDDNAEQYLSKTFTCDSTNVVLEKDIDFFSLCEHHLLPFFGKVHIAYIPNGKVVGLSKLARTVEVYAKRLQLQERMTAQIADAVMTCLKPVGVIVVSEAEHLCMTMRGVKKVGSKTMSIAMRGSFGEDEKAFVLSQIAK